MAVAFEIYKLLIFESTDKTATVKSNLLQAKLAPVELHQRNQNKEEPH